jgi:predicted  nucleic acid-binding Zn-ribbon protein
MPEISVKDQIRRLVELQKLDVEIFEKKREMRTKPAEVEELKQHFEAKKSRLNQLQEQLKTCQLKRKEQELELQQKEDQAAKANAALNSLKTNKEYTAKLSEIEHIKADKSIIEEKILKAFDEADAVNQLIEKEKLVVVDEEKKYQQKKKAVEDELKLIEDRVKVLESQRKQLMPGVDASVLDRYEKILQNKDGLAIVPVTNNSCGGCYMNLRPQNINSIKMGQDLNECEYCARIIYLEDDL